jgi:thymidine kinase
MKQKYSNLVTPSKAAKIAKMSPQLFQHYVRTGRAPEAIIIDETTFFDKREIAEWQPEKYPNSRRKYE